MGIISCACHRSDDLPHNKNRVTQPALSRRGRSMYDSHGSQQINNIVSLSPVRLASPLRPAAGPESFRACFRILFHRHEVRRYDDRSNRRLRASGWLVGAAYSVCSMKKHEPDAVDFGQLYCSLYIQNTPLSSLPLASAVTAAAASVAAVFGPRNPKNLLNVFFYGRPSFLANARRLALSKRQHCRQHCARYINFARARDSR